MFRIDHGSGTLLLTSSPDREQRSSYQLRVRAVLREEGDPVLFCPASATQLGGQRLLEDRYEAAMTRLGPSHIPGAEDGLFARVAVPPGTLLSFYHGLNVPYGCDYSQELYAFDEVDAEF